MTKREAAMLCTRQEKRYLGFINVHVGWSAGGQKIVAIQQNFAGQWFQTSNLFQRRRREEEVCVAEDQQATVANGITARPARQDLPGKVVVSNQIQPAKLNGFKRRATAELQANLIF